MCTYEALMNNRLNNHTGGPMPDCELCGAMKVGTRPVIMGRAEIQACKRCTEKMGLEEKRSLLVLLESIIQTRLQVAMVELAKKARTLC